MICILEDDDNIREIENFALKNCGFVTEPAASAKEFWEIMEHKIPQLILLDTGADDYISKPFGVLELISRVKAVLRRSDSAGDDTVITNGSIELNVEKHVVSYDGNNIELTYKEFELLRVLMKNAGNVMTREILMDRVWGTSYEGESRTLDMHIKTLRKKLGEDGGKLIKTVRNVGYKFQS